MRNDPIRCAVPRHATHQPVSLVRHTHARVALRNAGLLLAQRGGLVAAGFLFAALVPRLMGPEIYGRYALVLSLGTLFVMCSGLGFTEVIGRHVPELSGRSDLAGLRRLFGNLLMLRLASGTAAATGFLAVTVLWLRELDPVALVAAAAAIFARALSQCLFSFFLGLNQAARWGVGELLSRWLLLAFVVPGFALAGFRGACLGLLLTELSTMAVGLWWNRSRLSLSGLRVDRGYVMPYVRFGLIFFAGNLLAIAFQASGEALVRAVSRDYVQVSYFGLANGIYLTAGAAIQQLSLAFAAPLTTLRARGESERLGQGVKRLVTWLTAGSTVVVFAALLLGADLVPPVLGRSYGPVAANLVPMTMTLLVLSLASTAGVVVLTHDQPGVALVAGGVRLAAFWGLGPLLIAWRASLGACLAVLVASTLHAVYLGWRVRAVMRRALRAWVVTVGLGALFLPLFFLRASWLVNMALYLVFLVGYFWTLLRARVITPGEIAATWAAMSQPGPPRNSEPSKP